MARERALTQELKVKNHQQQQQQGGEHEFQDEVG